MSRTLLNAIAYFFLALALVCASRGLFHPLYFAAAIAVLALLSENRRWWRTARLPAVLLVVLMAKSFMLFAILALQAHPSLAGCTPTAIRLDCRKL